MPLNDQARHFGHLSWLSVALDIVGPCAEQDELRR